MPPLFHRLRQRLGLVPSSWLERVNGHEPASLALSDGEVLARWEACRKRVESGDRNRPVGKAPLPLRPVLDEEISAEALALAREAARRHLGLRAYDVQIEAALALIRGNVAEMATGEGKTLAAALAAACLALPGRGVHLATVNAYLAERDAVGMGPLFAALGLSVGRLGDNDDPAAKAAANGCAVTYGTGYEFGFDYLRDQLRLHSDAPVRPGERFASRLLARKLPRSEPLQPAVPFALIDEIDSVLIDEATTPLLISLAGAGPHPHPLPYVAADRVAAGLSPDDIEIEPRRGTVQLTPAALEKIYTPAFLPPEGALETLRLQRPWHVYVEQALRARHLFARDVDYLVRAGAIELIDEYTGRSFAERKWRDGLHQAVEAKEGLTVTQETSAELSISRQAFYRRYPHLCGTTGTARESAAEIADVYGLAVVPIPRHRPNLLELLPDRVFRSWDEKIAAMLREIARRHAAGQPIMIGTRTVRKSEELAAALRAVGLGGSACLLNARQDAEEAELIGRAGEEGRITIATNMAGRGADIVPTAGAVARGGLFVLGQERHESRRVDRQLAGRSGRQGVPGQAQFFLSPDDDLLAAHAPAEAARLRTALDDGAGGGELAPHTAEVFHRVQLRVEALHVEARKVLTRHDEQLASLKRHFAVE